MTSELDYLNAINKKLRAGKWIVVVVNKEVFTSNYAKEVFDEAKSKYPNAELFIIKVPDTNIILVSINTPFN